MNLALKTSLHGRIQPLTMEIIKIIRDIHQEFNKINVRNKDIIEKSLRREGEDQEGDKGEERNSLSVNHIHLANNSGIGVSIHSGISFNVPSVSSPSPSPSPSSHTLFYGPNEIFVRTRGSGWVIGRRANESHREFYLLLDESIISIGDIQIQLDSLAKQYFFNIFTQ